MKESGAEGGRRAREEVTKREGGRESGGDRDMHIEWEAQRVRDGER